MIGSYIARARAGALIAAGLAAAAGVLACGEDAAEPVDPIAACLAAAGVSADAAVAIRGFAFVPASLTVAPGTTVTWVNCEEPGVDAHTSTSDEDLWDSPLLSPGDVFTRTFEEAGEFPYHCTPHPTMQGVVIVEP